MRENKKGIAAWAEDMQKDEALLKKFENVREAEEVVKLAKSLGYDFTEDELMDLKMEAVSGGKVIKKGNWTIRIGEPSKKRKNTTGTLAVGLISLLTCLGQSKK